MFTVRRQGIPLLFAGAVLVAGACDDGEGGVTGPTTDIDPPSVVLTSVPDESVADHEVALEFTVTDDVQLEMVTVVWGPPDGPVESIPVEGKSYSGTCVHTFGEVGQFTIVLRARDTAGRVTTVTHDVSITAPAPGAPQDVTVEVVGATARIHWIPGTWAAEHEISVTRLDAPEADRTLRILDGTVGTLLVTGLAWDASYSAVVSAVNGAGTAEGPHVAFVTPAPDPPVLTRFRAAASDPTCLELEWTFGLTANYRVELRGAAEGDQFDTLIPSLQNAARLCASAYPILDGVTYTAQVQALLASKEYTSNTLEYTVDFHPLYSAAGSWTATWMNGAGETRTLRLHLADDDGWISGSWEGAWIFANFDSGPVSGSRTWAALDLMVEFVCDEEGYCPPNSLVGEFTDFDTIEATLDMAWWPLQVRLTRD